MGALHYVEQGLLDLDENVNTRLVSWRIPENEFTAQADVTLHRLLSHTVGVNNGLYRGYAPGEEVPTMQQVLDGEPPANSPPVRVDRVPGTEERYSNGGYLIVAQLLEDVLGKQFPEIMQEAVFGLIGMTSSTFEQSLPEELEARAATAHGWDVYAWRESPGLLAPGKWHIQDVAMGGLWTTAPDEVVLSRHTYHFAPGSVRRVKPPSDAQTVIGGHIWALVLSTAHVPLTESLITQLARWTEGGIAFRSFDI